jgi:hypothetical protein
MFRPDPFQAVVACLEKTTFAYRSSPEEKFVVLTVGKDSAIYNCCIRVMQEDTVLRVEMVVPVVVRDVKMRKLVAEVAVHANNGLPMGRFDVRLSEGIISFQVSHAIGTAGLDEGMVRRLFDLALATLDRYFPAYMRVVYGGHTPEDAVYLAELETHDRGTEESPATDVHESETEPWYPPTDFSPARKRRPRRPRDGQDS